jgi:hypothetical protein
MRTPPLSLSRSIVRQWWQSLVIAGFRPADAHCGGRLSSEAAEYSIGRAARKET